MTSSTLSFQKWIKFAKVYVNDEKTLIAKVVTGKDELEIMRRVSGHSFSPDLLAVVHAAEDGVEFTVMILEYVHGKRGDWEGSLSKYVLH